MKDEDTEEVGEMTDEELERHVVTCDYRGKAFKKRVLEEVRRRAKKVPD